MSWRRCGSCIVYCDVLSSLVYLCSSSCYDKDALARSSIGMGHCPGLAQLAWLGWHTPRALIASTHQHVHAAKYGGGTKCGGGCVPRSSTPHPSPDFICCRSCSSARLLRRWGSAGGASCAGRGLRHWCGTPPLIRVVLLVASWLADAHGGRGVDCFGAKWWIQINTRPGWRLASLLDAFETHQKLRCTHSSPTCVDCVPASSPCTVSHQC